MSRPAHALLLSGDEGIGLKTIAITLAESLGAAANLLVIEPDEKGTITIDMIHRLYQQTRSVRNNSVMVVLIDDADHMSHAAQNALLKLLEEPVEGVYFILTSHFINKLLSTIRSRSAVISIRPVDMDTSRQFIDRLSPDITSQKRQQLLFIAHGRPAEIARLLNDEPAFEQQAEIVRDAKTMLSGDTYAKVQLAYKYDKSRPQAMRLLAMMFSLIRFTALQQRSHAAANTAERIEHAMDALQRNGHVRTHLMVLATS